MAEANGSSEEFVPNAAMVLILQGRMVEARVEALLNGLGLSLRRLGILGHLRAAPGLSFSELARRAGIKVQSLHPIVDTLLDQGMVTTIGGVGQGRAAVLQLTAEGNAAVEDAKKVLAELDGELFGDGVWKDLGAALSRVAEERRRIFAAGGSSE